ncbi:hypothetical protein Droror1_Dr00028323 [Drosera rotundifolia]
MSQDGSPQVETQDVTPPEPRRSGRVSRKPGRYVHVVESFKTDPEDHDTDPFTYKEAIQDKDSKLWLKAMDSEMESMYSNKIHRRPKEKGNHRLQIRRLQILVEPLPSQPRDLFPVDPTLLRRYFRCQRRSAAAAFVRLEQSNTAQGGEASPEFVPVVIRHRIEGGSSPRSWLANSLSSQRRVVDLGFRASSSAS